MTVTSDGGSKVVPRSSATLLLDRIERVFFFTFDEGTTKYALERIQPFAALDTAVASSILLFPEFWRYATAGCATRDGAAPPPGRSHQRHRLDKDKEKKAPDRDDTRMLLDLGVIRRKQPLWVLKDGQPDPNRGARFDTLKLRCRLGPSIRKKSRSNGASLKDTDVLVLADPAVRTATRLSWIVQRGKSPIAVDGGQKQASNDNYLIDRVPALAALGLEQFGDSGWRFESSHSGGGQGRRALRA